MSDICVVHLVRAKNGLEPFKLFLTSYRLNRGGIEHDLLLIFKGFHKNVSLSNYLKLLEGIPYKSVYMRDFGFDINGYFLAARTFNYKYYCFLNSFSTLLDSEWLLKLYLHIKKPDVGVVGATGSYESYYTNILKGQENNEVVRLRLLRRAGRWLARTKHKYYFEPFPNYHIRTNGFMIAGTVMKRLRHGLILTKMDAHRFESGRNSMTKQIFAMSLNAIVVGKNGKGFGKEDWYKSETFRQGDQNNLLIADNRTNTYLRASPEQKKLMAVITWGPLN